MPPQHLCNEPRCGLLQLRPILNQIALVSTPSSSGSCKSLAYTIWAHFCDRVDYTASSGRCTHTCVPTDIHGLPANRLSPHHAWRQKTPCARRRESRVLDESRQWPKRVWPATLLSIPEKETVTLKLFDNVPLPTRALGCVSLISQGPDDPELCDTTSDSWGHAEQRP